MAGRLTVTAREAQDGDERNGTWTVRAYAICAFGVAGLERVSAPSELNSRAKGKLVFCPSGKVVVGTGADVDGPAGQVGLAHITPQESLAAAGPGVQRGPRPRPGEGRDGDVPERQAGRRHRR